MEKEQEKLRDEFEKKTYDKCWSEPHFNDVLFSDRYVKWLEKQLLIQRVSISEPPVTRPVWHVV